MVSKSITMKKTNKTVKGELLNSLQENYDVEEQGLNETANSVNKPQETMLIIRRYKGIINTENKKAIGYIVKQGQLSKKFKDTKHFFDKVGQNKSGIYFKISLYS